MESTKQLESKLITSLKSTDRFTLLEDGWIKDVFTGLDWGLSSEKTMNFKKAQAYCEENGGRLPEIQELHSLVDFTKEQPASYSILKTKHDDWCWSGTKTAWNKNALWCVSFGYGDVNGSNEALDNYVRPVRSSLLI